MSGIVRVQIGVKLTHVIDVVGTGVQPEFLGRVRLGSSIASLVGVWIFQSFLKEIKISTVLLWTALASVPLGFTQVNDYNQTSIPPYFCSY